MSLIKPGRTDPSLLTSLVTEFLFVHIACSNLVLDPSDEFRHLADYRIRFFVNVRLRFESHQIILQLDEMDIRVGQ